MPPVSHGGFDVELVDLAEFDMPVFDEPNHLRAAQRTKSRERSDSCRG
jgi:hypothetical protein